MVGVGASAGGLEAFTGILKELPANIGMAFVYVQHLDATHESMLPQLLSRYSKLPVVNAKNNARVLNNHLYVIPPNYNIELTDGHLKLTKRVDSEGRMDVIDNFFRSLGEAQQTNAIGVILSGNAFDGTRGLAVIKGEGGIAFVQTEKSAKFPGMPRSAIDSGVADFVLEPREIARELVRIARYPNDKGLIEARAMHFAEKDAHHIERIFHLLRVAHGVDFREYKTTTLYRRIEKRMLLHKMPDLGIYTEFLEKDAKEQGALFQDILISVTDFFRDPDTFEYLKRKIFPRLVKGRKPTEAIRIWCVGCSTGEETYSMAISILEFLEAERLRIPVQIFASDASPVSIATARQGIYSQSIASHISPARLRKYFKKVGDRYQVQELIREMCVFAAHDVLRDPPFSHVDLVSCRNVLIYFTLSAQRKVIPTFSYALTPNGFLLLGRSESVNEFDALFSVVDKKHKVFQKRTGTGRIKLPNISPFISPSLPAEIDRKKVSITKSASLDENLEQRVERMLLSYYTPPAVVVNSAMEIIQFRGKLHPYLQFPSGNASLNLLRMAHEDILMELRGGFAEVKKTRHTIRKTQVSVVTSGAEKFVDIEIVPLDMTKTGPAHYFVLFHETTGRAPMTTDSILKESGWEHSGKGQVKTNKVEINRLRDDLKKTKEQLRLSVEDQEATAEEFQTANEEILSTNEELQSINEELETAKEELQSTNEELTTVNEELQVRNSQLSLVNNDMQNFLANSDIPMVMVANNLSIRRITPAAERLLNFIPTDIGRPITHLKLAIEIPNLEERLHTTVNTMASQEFELQDRRGIWFSVRIRPYKTEENKIDGVVLTLVDIDELKKNLVHLEKTASDLKEHESGLLAAKQVLEEESSRRKDLERQKDEFIAILSHELRNPLSPILAHAELLRASAKQDSASNSAIKESADVIERHAKGMGRLLDDLLDVSGVISGNGESPRVHLLTERLLMNTAVRNAVETARTLAVEKKIDIVVKNTKTPVYIKGDPVRIEQILVNVLQNALKYSAPKTQIHVTLTTERKFVVIRIEDEGQGIEPLLLPKIFDLFTQGSHALKGKTPGLGIGLALARNLVQMHGGEISAESEGKGHGSTFTIKFPSAK